MSTLRTDTLVLGAQVNDVLGLADELRDAVRILKAKREAIRARVAAALPVESSGATFARHAQINRLQNALDCLFQPLSTFDLKAGKELSEAEIGNVAAQIAALVKE